MRVVRAVLVVSILVVVSRSGATTDDAAVPPLFEGLGGLSRKVTTSSPEAQRYFDQGLAFLYAFNHDEAIRSFRRAAELDPKCDGSMGVAVYRPAHQQPVVPEDCAKAADAGRGRGLSRARRL
jgi:hypothetical protein